MTEGEKIEIMPWKMNNGVVTSIRVVASSGEIELQLKNPVPQSDLKHVRSHAIAFMKAREHFIVGGQLQVPSIKINRTDSDSIVLDEEVFKKLPNSVQKNSPGGVVRKDHLQSVIAALKTDAWMGITDIRTETGLDYRHVVMSIAYLRQKNTVETQGTSLRQVYRKVNNVPDVDTIALNNLFQDGQGIRDAMK